MYVNTGFERCQTLTINKYINETLIDGYPNVYSILNAFGTYGVITSLEFKQLAIADYESRLSAFKQYVSSVEDSIDIDGVTAGGDARRENLISCPIGV